MGLLHGVGLFMCLAATALLVIVSVSVPVWDKIDMLHAYDRNYLLGIWGTSVNGVDSKARLGYNIFGTISNSGSTGEAGRVISKGLTYALILNPIAAGFAFLALLAALFSNTACGIFASILAFWAFLVSLVALAIDLATFVMARNRINNANQGANAALGKGIWFVVAATGALLIASITVCFTHSSSKRRRERDIETKPLTVEPAGARRGWFGRRNNTAVDPAYGNTVDHHAYGNTTDPAYGNAAYPTNGTAPVMTEKRHFWQRKQQPIY